MVIQAVSGMRRGARRGSRKRTPWLRRLALAVLLVLAAVLVSIVLFRFVNPPITSVIAVNKLRGTPVQQHWVPLKDMSRNLPLAVIASEDGRFCLHWGVDWGAVKDAINEGGGLAGFRGASTIPMQTAKNLYLWNRRSYVRKVVEVPLAYVISLVWPKERIMEVYLNVAQFGPGIFGAEAASRYYFGKSASKLTRREAVLLAATLPQPRSRNPAKPSARMLRIAGAVERRLAYIAKRADCLVPPR
ncbi:MAG: monofunctional biosynthetic peptidoglycan transglycosylase [Methyloceanibacter sp.]